MLVLRIVATASCSSGTSRIFASSSDTEGRERFAMRERLFAGVQQT